MRNNIQKSSLEEAFIKKDYEKLIRYAKHIIISSCRIPDSDLTGVSREDFINDVAYRGIQYAMTDYENGLFDRGRGTIETFVWGRVCKKAFYEVLKEFTSYLGMARFDEQLGKYYEGSAGHETTFDDEQDDAVSTKTDLVEHYLYSAEKEQILEDVRDVKMMYINTIKNLVSKMSPTDQRLFDIRFGFNLSEEDYQKIDEIQKTPHVKEYYNKLAAEEFGISEGAARKRVNDLLGYIKKNLTADGTMASYRQNTSLPGLSEFKVAKPETDFPDFNLDNLSEHDCIDILMCLKFQ